MKPLFVVLLMVNLFYAAWSGWAGQPVQLAKSTALQSGDGGQVRLLGEALAAIKGESTPARAQDDAADVSYYMGGLQERAQAEALLQRLFSLGVDGKIVQQKSDQDREYWVFLAPLSSRQAAMRQLRELQGRRIDGYLISEGPFKNGISLGVFPLFESAQVVRDKLQQQGVTPELKEVQRARDLYWVEIARDGRGVISGKLLASLKEDFAGLEYKLLKNEH